jgi:hypothetical protein
MKDTDALPGYKRTKVGVIPEEWDLAKMKDCLREIKDKSSPPYSKLPYLGLEHLDSSAMGVNRYGDSSFVQSNCSEFKRGNLLYGKLRPYLDKIRGSPGPDIPGAAGEDQRRPVVVSSRPDAQRARPLLDCRLPPEGAAAPRMVRGDRAPPLSEAEDPPGVQSGELDRDGAGTAAL